MVGQASTASYDHRDRYIIPPALRLIIGEPVPRGIRKSAPSSQSVSQSVVGPSWSVASDDPEESLEDGFLLFYFCSTYTLSGGSNASESGGYGEH